MYYLAQQLITRSWYLSGIVARNLQTPTGDQITDGLFLLNSLLNFKQVETDLIPYWTYIEVPLVGGQEYYFLPNILEIESATFNIDVVRYPMDYTSRRTYFGSSRVDNIQTLPFNWNFNRGQNGGTLSLYFLPQSNYPLKIMAKLFLNDVTLQQDLTNIFSSLSLGFVSSISVTDGGIGYTSEPTITISGIGSGATAYASISNGSISKIYLTNAGGGYTQTPTVSITGGGGNGALAQANIGNYNFLQTSNAGFDSSYLEYLRIALADYMCMEYGITLNPRAQKLLQEMKRELMFLSPPDLTRNGYSILGEGSGYNWGDVNIGRGWRPD